MRHTCQQIRCNMDNYINKLFELENDKQLLSFKTYDEIPIYFMAKYYLMHDVMMCKLLNLKISGNDRKIDISAFKFVGKALFHNLSRKRLYQSKRIAFYSASRPTKIDGKFINRYTDFLALSTPNQSFTIEQTAMDWSWPFPRLNEAVIFDGVETIRERLVGRVTKRDSTDINDFLNYFNNRAYDICNLKLTDEELVVSSKKISIVIASMRTRALWLDKVLPNETEILIAVGGGYPHNYPVNRMLKKRGIVSVDIQHGFITSSNLMYNFAPALESSDEAIVGSPDYFLTYGEWWNSQINIPSKKISIGNPYRDFCISNINYQETKKRIMLVGCEINTEYYIDLALDISKQLPDSDVVFRPHPGEVFNTKRILKERELNVKLDNYKEIYESLNNTEVVISEVSTVLFEAIGIVDNIIVMNTEYSRAYLPVHPFVTCNNANEVVDYITTGEGIISSDTEDIWSTNWKNNYINFINGTIGNK